MKHKSITGIVSMCILLMVIANVVIAPSGMQIQPNGKNTISEKTVVGGEIRPFRNYDIAGDFTAWNVWNGTFSLFSDSGTELDIQQSGSVQGFARRDFINISTNRLRTYQLCVYKGEWWPQFNFFFRFYYTDKSFTLAFNEAMTNVWVWEWFNGTFPAGKTLDYAEIWVWSGHAGLCGELKVGQEIYSGFMPYLENWTIQPAEIKQNLPTTFNAVIKNQTAQGITFSSEYGGTHTIGLYADWAQPNSFYNVTSFARLGLYAYYYYASNEWGNTTYTPISYFTVKLENNVFPKPSYLSLFNALSGFPLESKDFKIFLGDPDSRELINFRTFTGSWAVLNHNNLVNASLIINGTFEDQALVDNYLAIQAEGNGLKSPFEGGMTYNTTLWTILQFQVKVFQPTWIVIIYNPAVWEKDFYLYLGAQYVGYWLDISIPFFNFTSYIDVTHQTCYELGFWISNATILLANIRVASWYAWNGTAYEANPYRLCSLENRQNPNQLIFYSQMEALCIQDFYNNTLYYADVAYTPFLDIALPICDATFYNYENYTIRVQIYRGLNTYLEIVVPPHSAVTVPVYCTNYRVHIITMQQLSISYFSPNQTRNVIITWGIDKNITFPAFWEQLWQFLFQTPLGITLVVLFCIYLTYSVYRTIRPPRIVFKVPEAKKPKKQKKKADKELQDQLTKAKKEKEIWVGH